MINLALDLDGLSKPTILCLGAHSDDIEIGALGTIINLKHEYTVAKIIWVVFAAAGDREKEARASAEYCCDGFAEQEIRILSYRDGHFPTETSRIKEEFESLKQHGAPDLVLTHYREDAHQDHRVISDLTWQTFRDQLILEYEIPKYDGDLGAPSVFSPVSEETKNEKLVVLERFFESQKKRSWFTRDTFASLMRLRGVECNSPSGFAEAFYGRKLQMKVGRDAQPQP